MTKNRSATQVIKLYNHTYSLKLGKVIALLALSISSPIYAATITVDAFPGQPTGCNIIDAISSANQNMPIGDCLSGSDTGTDEILITGEHSIENAFSNIGGSSDIGDAALPNISSDIVITGVGLGAAISRSTSTASNRFRLINVFDGELTLNNLTIEGGDTNIPDTSDDSINRGGGIYVFDGSLKVQNSSIINNVGGSFGGGIYSRRTEEVEIINSTIDANVANSGAAFVLSNSSNPVLIEESTISNNDSRSNASNIASTFLSDISIKRSAIIKNKGTAINVFRGSLAMSDSTVSENATREADGISANIAGIALSPDEGSSFSILNSTIVNNPPQGDSVGNAIRAHGIRIIAPDSTTSQSLSVVLRNSIISANGAAGATISLQGSEIKIVDEVANLDAGLIDFQITDNIIGFSGVSTEIALDNVVLNQNQNQLLTSNSSNPTSLSAIVNPLDDYGGQTMSHTLPRNSPATNTATEGFFTFSGGSFLFMPGCRGETASSTTPPFRRDQRNLSRPVGGACDIGSTEFRQDDIIEDESSCFVIKAANANVVVFCL